MSELEALDASAYSMATSQMAAPQQSTHGLHVQFYMHPLQDTLRTIEEGRPIFNDTPYVMIMVPGDKDSVVRRPVRVGVHPKDDNLRFAGEYQAFQANKDQPIEGTPLAEWPLMTASEIREMEYFGIRTVENLAGLADVKASQFMGMQDKKKKANEWLQNTKDGAPMLRLNAELAERDNKIEVMQQQLEELLAKPSKKKNRDVAE
jgi:hypothetical protein|tara:strand:- start:4033 stop:4647 length:615 start_codon:yes stop_codon:yes gene_type:complete